MKAVSVHLKALREESRARRSQQGKVSTLSTQEANRYRQSGLRD